MPDTFLFTNLAGSTADPSTSFAASGGAGHTITAAVSDGSIEVGDAVTIAPTGLLGSIGMGDGQAFYLGTVMLDGNLGYAFGDVATPLTNPSFFVVFPDPADGFSGFLEVRDLAQNPGDYVFGTDDVACFLAGTLVSTPGGQTPVEALSTGDRILTAEGRSVAVKWIGQQTVGTRFGPADRLRPVRFAAGSLGNGLPHTDLTVTADHAMLVDGVLCHAGALVNGTSITRVPLSEMGETYTVYHIETETHEILLVNGAPAETLIDNVSRRSFDNFAEFAALYGDVPEMVEMDYPRAMSARQVPARIRAKLSGKVSA